MSAVLEAPQVSIRKAVLSTAEKLTLSRVMLIGLVIRLAVAVVASPGIASPASNFGEFGAEMGWTARSIALGHGFAAPFAPMTGPTALVPPLFPYLLAGFFRVFGLYTIQAALAVLAFLSLLSVLTCIPVYLAARHSFGPRTARFAAWAWTLYPFAIYFSAARVWDYALTSLLLVTSFWLIQTLDADSSARKWFGVGLLTGVTALSNPSVLPLLCALIAYAAWRSRLVTWTRPVTRLALAALGVCLLIAPWLVRNQRQVHVLSPVRDGFWLEFWAGNAGDTSTSNPSWAHPASNPVEMSKWLAMGEPAYLASKHSLAIAVVREHPAAFAVTSVRRFVRFWTGFWSFSPAYLHDEPLDLPNLPFCLSVTVLMVLGLRRLWLADRATALPFLAVVVLFPFPYYLSHSSMDYRQPIETIVVLLVARALIREPLGESIMDTAFNTNEELEWEIAPALFESLESAE